MLDLSRRFSSITLRSLFRIQILLFHLAPFQRRKLKSCLTTLQPRPTSNRLTVRPRQKSHPRLHVPMQRQGCILTIRDFSANVRDGVFRSLIVQLDDSRTAAFGIRFPRSLLFLCRLERFRFRFRLDALGCGVDPGVRMPGGVVGRDDGVPDDDFAGGSGRRGGRSGRGIGRGDVDEDLFRVPVE